MEYRNFSEQGFDKSAVEILQDLEKSNTIPKNEPGKNREPDLVMDWFIPSFPDFIEVPSLTRKLQRKIVRSRLVRFLRHLNSNPLIPRSFISSTQELVKTTIVILKKLNHLIKEKLEDGSQSK